MRIKRYGRGFLTGTRMAEEAGIAGTVERAGRGEERWCPTGERSTVREGGGKSRLRET